MAHKEAFDDSEFEPGSERVFVVGNFAMLRHREFELAQFLNRRQSVAHKEVFDDYQFERVTERVFVRGNSVTLTHKEFELALLLFTHMSRPLSRSNILAAIWKRDRDTPSRSIHTHMSQVRSKLGLRAGNGYRLTAIYGYGYRLDRIEKEEV